jgi:hypothetical protein
MPCARRMIGCKAACQHRRFVRDYQAERLRQEIAAENDFRERDGNEHAEALVTFHRWLKHHRRPAEATA